MGKVLLTFLGGFFSLAFVVLAFVAVDQAKAFLKRHRQSAAEDALAENRRKRKLKKKNSESFPLIIEPDDELEENVDFDEYTSTQNVLCVVVRSATHVAGVCALTSDGVVEYFHESVPKCCEAAAGKDDDAGLRSALAAMALWGEKWVYAEEVNLLCQDKEMVRAMNSSESRQNLLADKFRRRYEFNLYAQWTDNFVCEAAMEDLWENAVLTARRLLKYGPAAEGEKRVWRRFHLSHWQRTRARMALEHFHQVPHPGAVVATEEEEEKVVGFQQQNLVAIDEE